jgi:hypothetical protein
MEKGGPALNGTVGPPLDGMGEPSLNGGTYAHKHEPFLGELPRGVPIHLGALMGGQPRVLTRLRGTCTGRFDRFPGCRGESARVALFSFWLLALGCFDTIL